MSNSIVVFSTTPGMSKCCRNVFKRKGYENIPIYEVTASQSLELVKKCIKDGTKVIISRGGIANYMRSFLEIPIIDVRHSFLSIFLAINDLSKKYKNIALIGFEENCKTTQKYNILVKDIVRIYEVTTYSQYDTVFHNAVKDGAEVIIGGFQIKNFCEIFNIDYYSLEPDETEVTQALKEALYSLHIEEERLKQYNLIDTVLNSTSEGIIGIDKHGEILHINSIARKLLRCEVGRQIGDFLPLDIVSQITQKGKDFSNKIFTVYDVSIVINYQPIILQGQVDGAVLTLQEEDTIRILDNQIRKRKLGSGHFAKSNFDNIIGNSSAIKETKKIAKRYAHSNYTILISGETGTGKEVFAQSIHNYSERSDKPFIAVNCAALPQNLLESELFGYVKGAFTGARNEGKSGIFELAHRGTVFLDEISEMTTDMQVKLLRVLQEKEVTRIGDEKITPIDVRIIAACNKDLKQEIIKGNFREDLYYRICVLELKIPPLRERIGDILKLVEYFMKKRKSFTPQALKIMESYKWPGNIRQLNNVTERLELLCDNDLITEFDVSKVLDLSNKHDMPLETINTSLPISAKSVKIQEMEKNSIYNTLLNTNGNCSQTAKLLGISRTTLWRKIKKYQIRI